MLVLITVFGEFCMEQCILAERTFHDTTNDQVRNFQGENIIN